MNTAATADGNARWLKMVAALLLASSASLRRALIRFVYPPQGSAALRLALGYYTFAPQGGALEFRA